LNPYPKPTHSFTIQGKELKPFVPTSIVFQDLKEPEESRDASQQVYSKAKYLGKDLQGQAEVKLDSLGPTIRSEHHGNIEFRRLSKEHGGNHTEELEAGLKERRLTPRECALIQSFPPDYQFVISRRLNQAGVSSSGAYKIIGNAVPPVLAYNIAMRIQEIWDKLFI